MTTRKIQTPAEVEQALAGCFVQELIHCVLVNPYGFELSQGYRAGVMRAALNRCGSNADIEVSTERLSVSTELLATALENGPHELPVEKIELLVLRDPATIQIIREFLLTAERLPEPWLRAIEIYRDAHEAAAH